MQAETATPDLEQIAAKLLGAPVQNVMPAGGGGNSRIYRVESVRGTFALKQYPTIAQDMRDRLGTERKTLEFFARHHVKSVPQWIDGSGSFGMMSWVEGTLATEPNESDITQALEFIATIKRLSANADARALPPASEACLSAVEIQRQLETRLVRLAPGANAEPRLAEFLEQHLKPALASRMAKPLKAYNKELPAMQRCLIPADFGFHNALRDPSGKLTFIDFEYFGWDDPVKLAADFLLHPATQLPPALARQLEDGLLEVFADQPAFAARLKALYPCFGLRWALILLNEFLPERLKARAFARGEQDLEGLKSRQLEKARAMLDVSQTLPSQTTV